MMDPIVEGRHDQSFDRTEESGTVEIDGIPLSLPEHHFVLPPDLQSVATTALASEIGTIVGAPKDAFLRSVTFLAPHDLDWGIEFQDPPVTRAAKRIGLMGSQRPTGPVIGNISGVVATYSKIQPGDTLRSINDKRIGASFNAQRATEWMQTAIERDSMLSVAVGNAAGDDTLIQATILKPDPDTSLSDLGMVVWFWGCLCIKSIDKGSMFGHTVIKETDLIVSVNNILCDRISPAQFNRIVNELPQEITIVVKRGKQRWSGKFG